MNWPNQIEAQMKWVAARSRELSRGRRFLNALNGFPPCSPWLLLITNSKPRGTREDTGEE